MSIKYVYSFKEGNGSMRELLGGKGANLAEMTKIGLPVPQGFTISTEACTQYYEDGKQINPEIQAQIMDDYSASLIGQTMEVLVDGFDEEDDDALRDRYYEALQEPATSGNVYH